MSTITTEEPRWPELHKARRAIVVVDVVESVRLMQQHEDDVIDRWRRFVHEVRTEVLPPHGGRLVKSLGDGMLLELQAAGPAVAVARELHRRVEHIHPSGTAAFAIRLRIGVHLADVVVDDIDIYGSGVNLAARLTTLAEPGETVVSAQARDQLCDGLDGDIEDMGECFVKHFDTPVRAYRVHHASGFPAQPSSIELWPSVAVVPLQLLGDPTSPDLVGEIVADGVIGCLSATPELRVLSRLSTTTLRYRPLALEEIGSLLGATYIVSGAYRYAGSRVVLLLQMADARSASVIWSCEMVTVPSELLGTESPAIQEIARRTHGAVLETEVRRARVLPLPTLDSFSLLLGAISMMHRQSTADFDRSRSMLEHLSERFPRNATPKAWLAKWYAVCAAQGWSSSPESDAARARVAVDRALHSEPANSLAWSVKGLLHAYVDKDFDLADDAYREALASNPSEPLAWLYLGMLYGWRGEGEKASSAAETALSLSPLDPMKYYFESLAAGAMLGAGQYARAVALAQQSIRHNRSHVATHKVLTISLVLAGMDQEGKAAAEELLVREPGFTARRFMTVSPWRASPAASMFADALVAAGVPRQ